jgi:hypothetical protein
VVNFLWEQTRFYNEDTHNCYKDTFKRIFWAELYDAYFTLNTAIHTKKPVGSEHVSTINIDSYYVNLSHIANKLS